MNRDTRKYFQHACSLICWLDLQDFLAVGESSATGRYCESGQDFMEGELAFLQGGECA